MFEGAFVALVTPFKDSEVDEQALRDLIEFQIAGGTNGIVPCGTTGESATLSHEEHRKVVQISIDQVNKRIPVMAGAGSNSTAEAVELVKFAEKAGADAALLVTPYYNKPTQEGIYLHYKTVAENTSLPLFPYNVPGRTGTNILPETLARLAEIENIAGVKEATGDLKQGTDVIALCPEDFIVLSGDDFTTMPLMAVGGKGVISVVANVVPEKMSGMCSAALNGDWKTARKLHYELRKLNQAMFFETNPIPVKTALALMGKVGMELRLPLCPMSENNLDRLKAVMREYGLID
jgi:4-hydroxy-tetrahydrodipicolinate synthase